MIVLDTKVFSEALKAAPSSLVAFWLKAQDRSGIFLTSITQAEEAAGRPISHFDAMIAAIARLHGAAVATRNIADFEGCGIGTINPWNA